MTAPSTSSPGLRRRVTAMAAILLLVSTTACMSTGPGSWEDRRVQGSLMGAVVGAAAGAAIDRDAPGRGSLLGAAIGGLAGGLLGSYHQPPVREVAAEPVPAHRPPAWDGAPPASSPPASVAERVVIHLPSDVLFEPGSHSLTAGAYRRLDPLAETLRRHPDTEVVVKGHTDSQGSAAYNLELSELRAEAVRRYLLSQGVEGWRLRSLGFGETHPVASNATREGRQRNRRVEVELRPVDDFASRAGREPVDEFATHRTPEAEAT